ncbi:MAG: polyphenol oxidase family protein [Nannocystis sp.]|nr:polyphenol oxidase family protein [Nannocystis sp.]MBA3547798.1 polyphenol oxidase family protein [Nannocystis sp.]
MGVALRWTLAGDVHLAFSTVAHGDMRDAERRSGFLASVGCHGPCAVPDQVHGCAIAPADAHVAAVVADGLATRTPGPAIAVFGADCPGLCLAAGNAIAVAHCGWRGTAGGIVDAAIAALARLTSQPCSTWQAFIGPGISAAHYEVDGPVLDARSWPAHALRDQRGDRARLDLASAIVADLAVHGVTGVTRADVCTWDDPRLWSYRRRGPGLVQALVAWRD